MFYFFTILLLLPWPPAAEAVASVFGVLERGINGDFVFAVSGHESVGLEVFGFGWGVVGCVFGSIVGVKAVVGVVVVHAPAEDPVAVTFFVRTPVVVVAPKREILLNSKIGLLVSNGFR